MDLVSTIILIFTTVYLVFIYIKKKQTYWLRHGIPFVEINSLLDDWKSPKSPERLPTKLASIYRKYKGKTPIVGLYFYLTPVVLAVDLDLIRNILIADFQHFQDRGLFYNERFDPLSANLLRIEHAKWKPLRSKLSPTFSTGKVKFMFKIMMTVADELVKCLSEFIKTEPDVEVYEWLGRFTTDIIGTCAFGIECNCLKDPDTTFRKMGKKASTLPKQSVIVEILLSSFKTFAKSIGVRVQYKDVSDFFLNIVQETIAHREKLNIERNDFMSLLIKLKNSDKDAEKLTVNEIAAQIMDFFFAGFETSSTTLNFCLYELAMDHNKHIQNEARDEILTILEKYNGILCYEALNEMKFIEKIVYETLRKHPPTAGLLMRQVNKEYKVPNTNFTIPVGMKVLIPSYGIHHDKDIYPEPDKFDPSRFSGEQINLRPSCSFLSFGDGPRSCIGLRFGLMQTRIGLIKLLQNFEFSACPKTQIPIKYSTNSVILLPENGTWLRLKRIN